MVLFIRSIKVNIWNTELRTSVFALGITIIHSTCMYLIKCNSVPTRPALQTHGTHITSTRKPIKLAFCLSAPHLCPKGATLGANMTGKSSMQEFPTISQSKDKNTLTGKELFWQEADRLMRLAHERTIYPHHHNKVTIIIFHRPSFHPIFFSFSIIGWILLPFYEINSYELYTINVLQFMYFVLPIKNGS